MAELCYSQYAIEGTKENIADLYGKLQTMESTTTPESKNDWNNMWLGNLVTILGGNPNNFCCRGDICNCKLENETTLRFDTRTDYERVIEVWDFVKEKFPSLIFYFYSEVSGDEHRVTNDTKGKYFPERHIVEQLGSGSEYYESEGVAFEEISERIGMVVSTMEQMNEALEAWNSTDRQRVEDDDSDEDIYYYKITVIE